ncbi:MAG: helix-turn-helix transcriptional regulator [Tatlockia sp.]|nr:helix-turn-helix transcriptional regulator [Tatlockia sp.]
MLDSALSLRSYSTHSKSHSHDFAQFVLPFQGTMELNNGCHRGIVHRRSAAYIAPGQTHSFAASQDNCFLVFDIKEPLLINKTNQLPPFISLTATTEKFLSFVQSYIQENKADFFRDYLIENLLLNLLSPLISMNDQAALKARLWIDKHFDNPVNLEKLTETCHLSLSQLQRRFKQATGQTLSEYWREKRLSHAQLLLGTSSYSIEKIAYLVGYANISAFSRRFTLRFGHSPTQWREMTFSAKKMPFQGK